MRQEDTKVLISMHSKENIFYFSSALINNKRVVEYCETKGITDDFDKAGSIFKVLSENKVFPCHLHNVIDELI